MKIAASAVFLAAVAFGVLPMAALADDHEHGEDHGHHGSGPGGEHGGAPGHGGPAGAPPPHGPERHVEGPHGGPGPRAVVRMEFHERDVHRFHEHELAAWRGGGWHQEWHNGRYGWWWFAGGAWYFYERPVYPYPPMVSEVVVVEAVPVAPPPPVVVTAPPAVIAVPQVVAPPPPPPGPPPQQFWYYCDNPAGYYPYVQTCNSAFRQVPVTPGAPAAPQ